MMHSGFALSTCYSVRSHLSMSFGWADRSRVPCADLSPYSCCSRSIRCSSSTAFATTTWRRPSFSPIADHETHVYPAYRQLLNHSYYYNLRRVGPWIEHDGTPKNDELRSRLLVPGQQTLVIVFRSDYETFMEQIALDAEAVRMPAGLALLEDLVLLTPGPFEVCATAAIAAGGRELQAPGTRE